MRFLLSNNELLVKLCNISPLLLALVCWNFLPLNGCGVTPSTQERIVRFTVMNFTLPVQMVFTTKPRVKMNAPFIQEDQQRAKEVLYDFVKDAINDVIGKEGRKYLLQPYVIEAILKQITVDIEYTPMKCNKVLVDRPPRRPLVYDDKYTENCFVNNGTVVAICRPENKKGCAITPVPGQEPFSKRFGGEEVPDPATNVPSEYLQIHGTLKTTNAFMACWTDLEWRRMFDRVQCFLARSNLRKDFLGVFIDFT
ncbi:hypothetical protein KIN20_032505 [Parelaphostrongylus tenuis]|uniref:Uncharacterized protein n=1 Tax=Parelaphostrongylus tenuis TaxID=148309 RepID=A0AAD5WI45_PARTN|nr:hypothetical protein KIN20_032505 [Parelaphostrongylus tenuis]